MIEKESKCRKGVYKVQTFRTTQSLISFTIKLLSVEECRFSPAQFSAWERIHRSPRACVPAGRRCRMAAWILEAVIKAPRGMLIFDRHLPGSNGKIYIAHAA